MSNSIQKGFSISGLLAFSPEHKYTQMADVKLLQTQSSNNLSDITLERDKKLQDEHDDTENVIKFVNLRSVENDPSRVTVE